MWSSSNREEYLTVGDERSTLTAGRRLGLGTCSASSRAHEARTVVGDIVSARLDADDSFPNSRRKISWRTRAAPSTWFLHTQICMLMLMLLARVVHSSSQWSMRRAIARSLVVR